MKIPRLLAYPLFALPWAAAAFGIAWLVVLRFPPSGMFEASTSLDGKSPWIQPFLPAERVSKPGRQAGGWVGQRITDDPAYFTARVPGPYETAEVAVEFRPVRQPFLEFGMVRDAEGKDLELKPLYASELASDEWSQAESRGKRGYVRKGVLPDRLSVSDTRGLAVWSASSVMPLMQDPAGAFESHDISLRGSHDFYLVPTAKGLDMRFTLQAANRKIGNDVAVFRVYRGDEEIRREALGMSGSRDTRMAKSIEHEISIPDAAPGVYRIALIADDDVFVRKIGTTSRRWVIGPRLVFGDVVGFATSTAEGVAWTNSRHIVVETFHPEGLQKVSFGQKSADIKRTHTPVRMDRDDELAAPVIVRAPKGDMRVIGDGFFALREEAFFEPKPRRLSDGTNLVRDRIDAVLTPYARPEALGDGWFRARAEFILDPSLDRLRFVLSAPGVSARAAAVDIRRIDVTYRRKAFSPDDWWRILARELANAWHRL